MRTSPNPWIVLNESTAAHIPFDGIDEAPLGGPFLAFMREVGPEQGRHPEFSRWMNNELNAKRNRLLATFTLVASGCFNRGTTDAHVAKFVVDRLETIHDIADRRRQREIAAGVQSRLDAIDAEAGRWDWLHGHRRYMSYGFSEAGSRIVESLNGLAGIVAEHDDVEAYFADRIAANDDAFYALMNDVTTVPHFGRLAAFDFLELADTCAGISGISPRIPRYEYVSTANPQPGFFYVYLADGPEDDSVKRLHTTDAKMELGIDDAGLDALVGLICDAAISRLSWPEEVVIYDVESCLCHFAKTPENRMLSWGGDRDDRRAARRGC